MFNNGRSDYDYSIQALCPLVSVIIPVYNVILYLRESLESVINQTYTNLDIIIIDDGSTDGSGDICDAYQKIDKRIRVIHQQNAGLSIARNTGLNIIRGDIVGFLDSDDVLLPDMIEILVNGLLETNADIATCEFYAYQTMERIDFSQFDCIHSLKRECVSNKKALNYLTNEKLSFSVWNKLYKKQLFSNLQFPEGRVYEDVMITSYIIERAKKILLIHESLILHRKKRPGSITETYTERHILDWLFAAKKYEEFVVIHTPSVFSMQKSETVKNHMLQSIIRKFILFFHLIITLV